MLSLIHGVLRSLVSAGVVDPREFHSCDIVSLWFRALCSKNVNDFNSELEVRLCVLQCFCEADRAFLSHLAQPEMLQLQFMSLHDEKLEMQEVSDL